MPYSFTLPSVKPATMYFCVKAKMIIVGRRAITIPALSISHETPAFEINELSATGIVIFVSDDKNITAKNSSFQILTKEKEKIAARPGNMTGTMT